MVILENLICAVTILFGLFAIIQPRRFSRHIGLDHSFPRGLIEMRAGIGALFIGLGAAPWILGVPETYQMLGIVYLARWVVRFTSMVMYRSFERSNWVSLAIEIVFAVILLIPIFPAGLFL